MKITFEEKADEQYEVQSKHVNDIFESIKQDVFNAIAKYKNSERDTLIATMAASSVISSFKQILIDEYGADYIIKVSGAIKIN